MERLAILAKLGFRDVPINYRQPALAPEKKPLEIVPPWVV
jgi:hypothetical protein